MEPQFGKVQRSTFANMTHSIHVWCIYLRFTIKYQANVGKYTIDEWDGLDLRIIGYMSDMMPRGML